MILQLLGALLAGVAAYAQMPGYGGPGIASRGTQPGNRGTESVSIRPYVAVMGFADNGLIGVGLTQDGEIVNPGVLFGVEASVGAYGTKNWRRSSIGLDYQGSYRNYTKNHYYNGSDHILGMTYSTQATRRISFQLGTFAGTTSRTAGGTFSNVLLAPQFLGNTLNDVFDNRAYFLNGLGQMTIQLGSRNYAALSASGFAVRRQSSALVGLNGQMASGTFGRRLTRRSTLGLVYNYVHVDYPRVFGEADSNLLMVRYGRQVGRHWSIDAGIGLIRTDFTGVREVKVDPVVAELFGITTGREAFNTINMASAMSLALSRSLRRGSFNFTYNRGVNPGNGALLLSRQETYSAVYSYNTGGNWSFSTYGNLSRFAGYGEYNDRLFFFSASVMATRRLTRDLHLTSTFDVRKVNVTSNSFRRVSNRFMIGLAYSPGEIPISLR